MKYEILCPLGVQKVGKDYFPRQVLPPFCEEALQFVETFSAGLFEKSAAGNYPELAALAFWMRRSRLEKIKKDFREQNKNRVILGRGCVFHIAPANVDTMFIYSWFLSLLMGNGNVVRVSGRSNPQVDIIIDILNTLLEDERFSSIRKNSLVIRYGHDDEVTSFFSSLCDVRVIWGGDASIAAIRSIPIPPASLEIPFPDRFSLAVIDAASFSQSDKQDEVVRGFYNDAFWFSQMACSSPRLLVWLDGKNAAEEARQIFWQRLEELAVVQKPDISAADVMNKFVSSSMMAVEHPGIKIFRSGSGLINRVAISKPEDVDEKKHCGGGLFLETAINDLDELVPWLERNRQTVSSWGIDGTRWRQMFESARPRGGDRVVPIGSALDFNVVWDGMDLLRSYGREVSILP